MTEADIIVIGGGVAGLSAAAALSPRHRVVVLEAEGAIGYHSSGRSATMVHYALGDAVVRALTAASRPFFEQPPGGFSEVPLAKRMSVLIHAREDELGALEELDRAIAPFARLEQLNARGVAAMCPILRVGEGGAVAGLADRDGLRLDPHAMLQGFARQVTRHGGSVTTNARIERIERRAHGWRVVTATGAVLQARLLINAAGAWADTIATLAGAKPIGLQPMRRTIITFDAPPEVDLARVPFTKTVGDALYFAAESGRLFASPMDEVPSAPTDAQPDELEVALAAQQMEARTTVNVRRIEHRWAGLRSFTPDRRPVFGFAHGADGFLWLAGQGGFGLQTAPAMAAATAALVENSVWPLADVAPSALDPARFD